MLEIILAGGWMMAPIILCSVVAAAIVIERFWTLRRSAVIPSGAPRSTWLPSMPAAPVTRTVDCSLFCKTQPT